MEDWHVEVRGFEFTVPAGTRTDGASIPRFLWRVCGHPLQAPRVYAATLHDWLYEHGADIDGYGSYGSALESISSSLVLGKSERSEQKIEILFWLLDNGANPVFSEDGNTVLHHAARGAYPELIPILIEQYGLDVNARGYMQRTPLISAVSYTVPWQDEQITKAIVTELLAHGADASAVDEDGKTAYDYAVERGYSEVAALLDQE